MCVGRTCTDTGMAGSSGEGLQRRTLLPADYLTVNRFLLNFHRKSRAELHSLAPHFFPQNLECRLPRAMSRA